ncbi:MAG TPA: M28 family peptidase [Isosphaeraceae bacterium]
MMTMELSDAIAGEKPTRGPRVLPHWLDWPMLLLPVGAGVIFGLIWPLVSWLRTPMDDPGDEADVAAAAAVRPAPIDGERAYGYLKRICELGPRPAGSAANTKQRQLVADHFRTLGAIVREQPFPARDPLSGAPVAMANLVGSWFPARTERVVIGAHYDTRPFPDLDPDPALRKAPFLGANDGASGVALLMEIAHHLKDSPTPWGVDLVLFDGEELVYDRMGDYFLGSKEFARLYKAERAGRRNRSRYIAGFVLDMVGDRELDIRQEPTSRRFNPRLVRDVWAIARSLGAAGFRNELGAEVLDDHLPLIDAGIPAIDLIDFDYPYWHTSHDLPEHCSAASLAQVGRVVTAWLARPKPRR